MDKEEIIQNFVNSPLEKPALHPKAQSSVSMATFLIIILVAIVVAVFIREWQTAKASDLLFFMALFGSVICLLLLGIKFIRTPNHEEKLYNSPEPEKELYDLLFKFGTYTIGNIETTRAFGMDSTLIRYHFLHKSTLVHASYATKRNVQYDSENTIYVLHYKNICSIPLVID